MYLHAEIPLVALLGLIHLRIPLPLFVFGGAGRRDQGEGHDRALAHRHTFLPEMGWDGLKNLLTQLVLLRKVAEDEVGGLIGDPIAHQLDARKAASGGDLDQGNRLAFTSVAVSLAAPVTNLVRQNT